MPPVRSANIIAFRTYAVLLGALTGYCLYIGFRLVWLARAGLSQMPFGGVMADRLAGALYVLAVAYLAFAVICGVLTPFAWRRSLVAAIGAFAFWVLLIGGQLVSNSTELDIIPVIITVVLALPLAAAIATRRRASLPAT